MIRLFPGYCFDTSALIDLKCIYPREVFPSLWTELEKKIGSGDIIAPIEVLNELLKRDDELSKWAKRHPAMFKDLNEEQTANVLKIIGEQDGFIDPDKETPEADPFVIALAITGGDMVVTSEKPGNPGGRPKIPDVCDAYRVGWLSLIDLFKKMGWKF